MLKRGLMGNMKGDMIEKLKMIGFEVGNGKEVFNGGFGREVVGGENGEL